MTLIDQSAKRSLTPAGKFHLTVDPFPGDNALRESAEDRIVPRIRGSTRPSVFGSRRAIPRGERFQRIR